MSIIEFIDFESNATKNQEPVVIKDECSFMKGVGLVHQIRDEDDCSITCNNRCSMEGSRREKIEFTMMQNDCNTCTCYCE